MKLERFVGRPVVCHCDGCNREGLAGDEPYESASTGVMRQPEDWYTDGSGVYCAQCSAKLMEGDPTRSVTTFYTNTEGTVIDPEVL